MLVILVLSSLLATAPASAAQGAHADDPQALAAELQKKYEAVRDFSADFTHTYRGGALRRTVTERGQMIVKKPGKMRWTYESPERKVFVSDGTRIYSYIPEDRQVIINAVPRQDEATTPALFLAGKGQITRDFVASSTALPDAPADTVVLKLVPRRPDREYDSLVLALDRRTLQIRMLVAGDNQGGQSTFTFTNIKENVGLPDSEFTFKIPRGVDVINNAGPGR